MYILGIDAQVQNALGENVYGLFFTLFTFSMLFQIVLDPGILNYNSQLVSKNTKDISKIFAKIAGSKIILILSFLLAVQVGGLLVGFPTSYFPILYGVSTILILNSFLIYLRSHFSALGHYKYEGLFSGLDKLLMILIIGYFLYVKEHITLNIFILSQIVALIISCFIFLLMLRRFFKMRIQFSFSETKSLIKSTAPYALVLLLMTLYTRLDGLMLERLLDDDAYSAGVYATGFRLLDAANMIGILFAMLMLPMFSKLIDKKDELNSLVSDITKVLFLICTLITLTSWFYAEPIIDFIYTNSTEMHYDVFKYLMIGFWAMCISNIYGCLFLAKGQLKTINWLFFGGIIINVSLNFLWIPKDLAFGAVKATIFTQLFVFVGQFLLATKIFQFKHTIQKSLAYLLVLSALIAIFYGFERYISWHWLIEMLFISFLALVLSFLCGFLRFPIEFRKKLKPS